MATNEAYVAQPTAAESVPQREEKEPLVSLLDGLIEETAGPGHTLKRNADGHLPLTPGAISRTTHAPWWKRFWPEHLSDRLDKLFAEFHMGNYVAIRAANGRPQAEVFESMPIYVRIGMHLLFFNSEDKSLLQFDSIDAMLKNLSIKQGRIYDDTSDPEAVLEHINSFIETYSINTSELLNPDLKSYACFNEFFFRKLRPDARPIANQDNARVISSSADCRLTVFDNVDEAKKFWIKGKEFSIASLIDDQRLADEVFTPGSDIVIFRLAPSDYHRFAWPIGPAIVGPRKSIEGGYYTVNPQAVNQDFDVFTTNRRDVLLLNWSPVADAPVIPVAYIAIGAMLVGSIGWEQNAAQGSSARRGDLAGYYAYGGSTSIAIFPPQAKIKWDQDLLDNSRRGLESMVRLGDHLGEVEQ